ncbi:MAG: Exodeoxyribonuclease 7 large subunit [Candidatus Tokpelaia sp. JSC188]|nr:MAG: Exodeoxyribonuclease 7 large subunit [Candidatus Tokpelaia sp. JSC188]
MKLQQQSTDSITFDGIILRSDLIIVARGGGNLEDLWGVNDMKLPFVLLFNRIYQLFQLLGTKRTRH